MQAISREFQKGLPWELLYADELVLIAESLEELDSMYAKWKCGMEEKGLCVNIGKAKVKICQQELNPKSKTGK